MAGCAQAKKPAVQLKAAAVGSRFDQVGRVTLYAGEPCTTQIMFDFHGAGALSAVAIGFIAIGRLVIGRAKIKRLEIGELRVTRLHVTDSIVTPPQPRQ